MSIPKVAETNLEPLSPLELALGQILSQDAGIARFENVSIDVSSCRLLHIVVAAAVIVRAVDRPLVSTSGADKQGRPIPVRVLISATRARTGLGDTRRGE